MPFIGRNPIYIAGLCLFVIFQIPAILAKNIATVLVFRCVPLPPSFRIIHLRGVFCRFFAGFVGSPALATGGASMVSLRVYPNPTDFLKSHLAGRYFPSVDDAVCPGCVGLGGRFRASARPRHRALFLFARGPHVALTPRFSRVGSQHSRMVGGGRSTSSSGSPRSPSSYSPSSYRRRSIQPSSFDAPNAFANSPATLSFAPKRRSTPRRAKQRLDSPRRTSSSPSSSPSSPPSSSRTFTSPSSTPFSTSGLR